MDLFGDIRSREYDVSDILKKTLRGVFGPAFWDTAGPVIILALAAYGVSTVLMFSATDRMGEWGASSYYGDESVDALPDFLAMQAMWLLVAIAVMVVTIICIQYVLRRMRQYILNESEAPSISLRRSLDPIRFLDFVVTGFIAMAMMMIGHLFCFVPGMALYVVFIFLPACLTFGEDRFRVPIAEPFRLITERFWKTAGVLGIFGACFMVISFILSVPLTVLYMRAITALGPQSDFNAMWQDQIALVTNPRVIIVGGLSAVASALFYVVLGFASIVMYLNYTNVTPTAAGAVVSEALRNIYEVEKLKDREITPGEDIAKLYSDVSDERLLDIYQQVDPQVYQDKFIALLAEIKKRVEERQE